MLSEQLRHRLPPTGDSQLHNLLERGRQKFLDPDPAVQREAVEHAWDAFERAKTVLHPDKKRGAQALAATVGEGSHELELSEDKMHVLTAIGNRFRIRHHETSVVEPSKALLEYLFARMYVFLFAIHLALVAATTRVNQLEYWGIDGHNEHSVVTERIRMESTWFDPAHIPQMRVRVSQGQACS